jgi:6-pyruvoyl-tetrahydropterin synthase
MMMSYNDLKKADKEITNHMDQQARNQEKFNFFPFISSDVIEEHRHNLGRQLKNDLQSYLQHTKYTPHKKDWDNNSIQKSQVGSMGHTSGSSAYVKSLFDSDYIPPQNNEKVM